MYDYGQFIDGEWVTGGGAAFSTYDPARPDQPVGRYTTADRADVERALTAARDAQKAWRAKSPAERAHATIAFLDAVAARTEDLARAITAEQGKPLHESRAEAGKALREARNMVAEAGRTGGTQVAAQRAHVRNLVLRRPRGLIAAITPWNFPVLTPVRKIAPALAFGNAIVLKPSDYTPAALGVIAEASAATLPPGLLQIVQGAGETGAGLVAAPSVDGVSFTGSVETGRAIMKAAAENLAEVSLEMGGKNAVVINDTRDLAACLDQIVHAAFVSAGQRCTAISRVLVADHLADDVVDGLVARAQAQVLGPGDTEGTTMGPLTNRQQLDRVDSLVAAARQDGAGCAAGGARAAPESAPEGFFYAPTVLTDVDPANTAFDAEIFGPVLSVTTYRGIDQGLDQLNASTYGLTAALFSEDNTIVQRFLDEAETGMLHVNHGTVPDDHMPFGGIKNSGVGAYSVGPSAANLYTTEHSAYVKYAP